MASRLILRIRFNAAPQTDRASSAVNRSRMEGGAGNPNPVPGVSKNSSPALPGALVESSTLTICMAMTRACIESAPAP